jgi:hypothetical protein
MTAIEITFIAAVVAAFVGFALVLAWGWSQTRDLN